jgi:hypothetical protein
LSLLPCLWLEATLLVDVSLQLAFYRISFFSKYTSI